jgi:hypothetical protein
MGCAPISHITRLEERDSGVRVLDMHYPLVHHSNQRPYHFIHAYAQFLEEQLDVRVPPTRFHGDVHLADEEKESPLPAQWAVSERFWIIVAGGKYDFTAKWWSPASYQAVVDHFRGRIHFVQCGQASHWHPPLHRVTNLVGRMTLRDFIRLMYPAEGVVCPVTLAMHLAAAVETPDGRRGARPCVVLAGGREPPHWEAVPGGRVPDRNQRGQPLSSRADSLRRQHAAGAEESAGRSRRPHLRRSDPRRGHTDHFGLGPADAAGRRQTNSQPRPRPSAVLQSDSATMSCT